MGFVTNLLAILSAGIGLFLWQNWSNFDAQPYSFPSPPALVGPLAPNTLLRNAKLLLKDELLGPESILVEGDTFYTGTWDGKIHKIVNNKIEKTLHLIQNNGGECATYETEPRCGRPLGIRRLNNNELVVVDTYYGVFSVNMETGTFKLIFSSDTKVGGYASKFLNDVEVINEDTLLVTDSSVNYDRRRFMQVLLQQAPVGRLLEIKVSSGAARVLLGGLYFANGVQLHPDKQSVIISECSMSKLLRFYISGPKAGEAHTFIDNLPGFPDNIRLSTESTFYVALASPRFQGKLSIFDWFGPRPWIRNLLNAILPDYCLSKLFGLFKTSYGFAIELNADGKILGSYQDPDGLVISDISQVSNDKDYLYLGSFHSNFIAQVPKVKRTP